MSSRQGQAAMCMNAANAADDWQSACYMQWETAAHTHAKSTHPTSPSQHPWPCHSAHLRSAGGLSAPPPSSSAYTLATS